MSFTVHFQTRDFSGTFSPLLTGSLANPIHFVPVSFSWSAFGGPDKALLTTDSPVDRLFDLPSLIRCPVAIKDGGGQPVWWGFVSQVTIYFEHTVVTIAIENLFNQVKVEYSFISPDNKLGEQLATPPASSVPSQSEYGTRELVVKRFGIDDDFALSLRDTLLNQFTWPMSTIAQRHHPGHIRAEIKCAGWFSTLSWKFYQNLEGFWGNYGPGPGVFFFDNASTSRYPAQRFTPGAPAQLKYVWFQLRKVGAPTRNLTAELRSSAGSVLAVSDPFPGASLSDTSYTWVKFTFSTPVALTAGTTYMVNVTSTGTDPSHHFSIRSDENQSFIGGHARFYNGSSWGYLPSITQPGGRPDLFFRVVTITDTGTQLYDIASSGSQFFNRIESVSTGVFTSPYRDNGLDCLSEVQALMNLGTANHRLILASVTPNRHLIFTEQPDPNSPAVYLDRHARFLNFEGIPLKSYLPPVGSWARFSATNRINLPWDRHRIPPCFIMHAEYFPAEDHLKINNP